MNNNKVWLVTGASKGLGLALVKRLLQDGYQVAATSRNHDALSQAVALNGNAFLPLTVDLRSEESVAQAIRKTMDWFGRIDVVVNNAGYGQLGGLEELSDAEARANFDINVFGVMNMIRYVLPHMRAIKAGHIFNIASIGGFTGTFPGGGVYCATKFAVAGMTESLAAEVTQFGIKATVVYPGYFRTNFLAADSLGVPERPIAAYQNIREMINVHETTLHGNQSGDPEKAAQAIIQIAAEPEAPLHLFLGQDAYDLAYQKMDVIKTDLEKWKPVITATAFDNAN